LETYYKKEEVDKIIIEYKTKRNCEKIDFEIADINKNDLFIKPIIKNANKKQLQFCQNNLKNELKQQVP
jgi:hypothetical protein